MIRSLSEEDDITAVENFDGIIYPTNFPYPNGNAFGLTNEQLTSIGIHSAFIIVFTITPPVCFTVVILLHLLGNMLYNNGMSIYEQSAMVFVRGFMSSLIGYLIWIIFFVVYKKYWEKK